MQVKPVKRMELRIDADLYDKVLHFADKQNVTRNQFMEDALHHYIKYILSDYDLPTAEIKRLNQLCTNQHAMTQALEMLAANVNDGFKGLNYTLSGNDYLDDDRGDDNAE